MPTWTVAGVQMRPELGNKIVNLRMIEARLKQSALGGAKLIVFPECALTGYGYDSKDRAWPQAETIPGPATEAIAAVCKAHDVFAVFGLLEKDGERLFNACALVGPSGLVGSYRKTHLLHLGVDRFTT